VLPQENGEQIRAFMARHPDFAVVPPAQTVTVLWDKADELPAATLQSPEGLFDDPAPHRDRRVFRERAEAGGLKSNFISLA